MEPPQRVVEGPGSRQSGSKRLKIDVACDTCRAKKVKCDGVRPGKSSPDVPLVWDDENLATAVSNVDNGLIT